MKLPEAFENRMREMLGDAYTAFRAAYDLPHYRGFRLNTLKCDFETLQKTLPFALKQTPFSPLSFYVPEDARAASFPLYHAGAFYAQEPSAASAVTLLDPQPNERVLDLCAAPGGKSSQIAALTGDTGLLWANEIVHSRATVLASNLERMGVRNCVVSNAHPERIAEHLGGYFDRVLVDAPCSGEGMFRRDAAAVSEWSEAHVAACAQRQAAILDSAAACVREGGVLVYSTCTFSMEENENTVRAFLERHPAFYIEKPAVSFGSPAFGLDAVRIYPTDGGEGHFAARMRRVGQNEHRAVPYIETTDKGTQSAAAALYTSLFTDEMGRALRINDRVLCLPESLPSLSGLPIVRAGVELGTFKKNRLEPSHGIFMAHRSEHCKSVLRLPYDSPMLAAFLRGEEIPAEGLSGYTAVAVEGVICGFGKASGGTLKNKYPKGLRTHN